jgi:hypothetical protein
MMIKRLMLALGSVALLAVFSLAADQPLQSGGRMMLGMGSRRSCNYDFSKTVSLVGTVESIAMAQGQGFPHFVLALADGTRVTVVTAPFRAVLDANYEIANGDQMSVVAFKATQNKDMFVAAELTNLSHENAVLTLRDASGAPVAGNGRGNGRGCAGRGNGTCGNCPNR